MEKQIRDHIYAASAHERQCGECNTRINQVISLFQAQHEQDIKAFEEMIGKDNPTMGMSIADFGQAIHTNVRRNELRAELRTKLDQYKKENV